MRTERATRIRRAVSTLCPALRECVLLHFLEGLTYREIADVVGVGLGTVARRVRKGLAAIRDELGDDR